MHFQLHDNPTLTLALALTAGMIGHSLARHMRLPGIVLLLGIGVVLGPDVANVIQPESLGEGLMGVVGFAVAVILFEGGMSLDVRRLWRAARPIRQLILIGAPVSLLAGALLVSVVLGWEWQRSLLFGSLVVVTGPTVVTPLLRRLSVKKSVSTVLEAEGVLVDAVGAITAAVALELVTSPSGEGWALAAPIIAGRLAFGAILGLVGGVVLAALLRFRNLVPEGLENTFTLAFAVLVFQVANSTVHESGIAAVVVAGLVVGNSRTHVQKELAEFKEQLTVMLIGLLFVLLSADVRLADVQALGWEGALVAAGLIVLVRPLSVWTGTLGTELKAKERVFIGWIGPRGIVAAAVASLFGYQLEAAGIEGGTELRALVFLIIAVTVVWSALTGGPIATLLDLRRKKDDGWLVLGGNRLAREVAALLQRPDGAVLVVDQDPHVVHAVEEAGLRALLGGALEPRTAQLAELDTRTGAIALTSNEEVNYLFGEKSRLHVRTIRYPILLTTYERGVTPEMVHDFGGEVLFGACLDADAWSRKLEDGDAEIRWWRFKGGRNLPGILTGDSAQPSYVPLVHFRGPRPEPVTDRVRFRKGSVVAVLVAVEDSAKAKGALEAAGWEPTPKPRPKLERGAVL